MNINSYRFFIYTMLVLMHLGNTSALASSITDTESANLDTSYSKQLSALLTDNDTQALALGRNILAIQQALDNPERVENLEIISELGRDQRYYMLVRGWLQYQLQADRSIFKASQGQTPLKIQQRMDFLQKAIRMIDLE